MTREIKFRIWCEKEKKMYEPFGLAEYMSYNEQTQTEPVFFKHVHSYSPPQFY